MQLAHSRPDTVLGREQRSETPLNPGEVPERRFVEGALLLGNDLRLDRALRGPGIMARLQGERDHADAVARAPIDQ